MLIVAQEEIDSISQYVRKTGSLIASKVAVLSLFVQEQSFKGQLKEKRLEAISKALPAASDSRVFFFCLSLAGALQI